MCGIPPQSALDHLDETGECLMCNKTGQYGMLPCPFCQEEAAGTALKWIVAPLMGLGVLAIIGLIVTGITIL